MKKLILTLTFLGILFNIHAQNQTISETEGCGNLDGVMFSTTEAGTWDWGTGPTTVDANEDKTTTFALPGTYPIKFNGAVIETIIVYPLPVADFSVDNTNICQGQKGVWNDLSTSGVGIASWEWDFGTGTIFTTQDPNYTFNNEGVINAILKVTDNKGCKSSVSKPNYLQIAKSQQVYFSTNPSNPNSCSGPVDISFTNASSPGQAGGSLTYDWDFGNGTTSTDEVPSTKTYTGDGNYTITLTATESGGGCPAKSYSRSFTIGSPQPIIDGPDTACINTYVTLENSTVGNHSWSWFLDGALISTSKNPNYKFLIAGKNEIKLVASSGGCSGEVTKEVFVEEVTLSYAETPEKSCDMPMCITFNGNANTNGSPIDKYNWVFSDLETDSIANPVHCFRTDTNQYTVHDTSIFFQSNLNVVTEFGCAASWNTEDTLQRITAYFYPSINFGCAPLTVNFIDSTKSIANVNAWEYDFGDGTAKDFNQKPTHTFTTPGEFEVTLIAKDDRVCIDTSYKVIIYVGGPLDLNMNASPSTVCLGDSVTFTDASPDSLLVDAWNYSLDKGRSDATCPDSKNSAHAFFHEVGSFSVTQQASYNGCITEKINANIVTVNGPSSNFYSSGNCDTPYEYTFHAKIGGVSKYTWDFGDGSDSIVVENIAGNESRTVTHLYDTTGDFTIYLISENPGTGCVNDMDSIVVKVRDIKAGIGGDSVLCAGIENGFSPIASSRDVHENCQVAYRWFSPGQDPQYKTKGDPNGDFGFSGGGNYDITLIVSDINGCSDTASKTISVQSLMADFTVDNIKGCLPFNVNFTDISTSDTTIVAWTWSNIVDGVDIPISNNKNTNFTFTDATEFKDSIALTIRDSLGCIDQKIMEIFPIVVDSNFSAITDRTICAGEKVKFRPTIPSALGKNYAWTFEGIPGTFTDREPEITYPNGDTLSVTLVITDTNNCTSSMTRTDYIRIEEYPIASFWSNSDIMSKVCAPFTANFIDSSLMASVNFNGIKWTVNSGDPVSYSNLYSSYAGIYSPGIVEVTLEVETRYGCKDDTTRSITVEGPIASFSMDKEIICLGDIVTFSLNESDTTSVGWWQFIPGDGVLYTNQDDVQHVFTEVPSNGKRTVTLLAKLDSTENSCSAIDTVTIDIHLVDASFFLIEDTICANDTVSVNDQGSDGTGNVQVTWDFANGYNPTYATTGSNYLTLKKQFYPLEGQYIIKQTVENSECSDEHLDTLVVNPLPNIATSGASICDWDEVKIGAIGAETYAWLPSATAYTPNNDSTIVKPSITTTYTVTGTDTNGCVNSEEALVVVFTKEPDIQKDTCIIIGDPLNIGLEENDQFTFDWSNGDLKWLDCTSCGNNDLMITEEDTLSYVLDYEDELKCYLNKAIYNVCIIPNYTFNVPSAFTPNNNGKNDIIYVKGHGIKKLNYFTIYNRWGEEIFHTEDLNVGWDGTYKGALQNMESYIWKVEVEYWNSSTESKSGTITLVR